jgi:glycosyltransferase involved in cell wall biosynthesis
MSESLTVTAIVPSYGRPDSLLRCLDGLLAAERVPDQIIMVLREGDAASRKALGQWQARQATTTPVQLALVDQPGQIAALNAGLAKATGDLVCFPDDDCIPPPDWLRRILSHYAEGVGGVGGRDQLHYEGMPDFPPRRVIGKLTWYGRIIGNHHHPAVGGPRPVDHLKGVNMTFRRTLLPPFDPRIRGPHFNDTDISLAVKRQGYLLLYDPEARVDHYPAPRADNPGGRDLLNPELITLDSHDWMYVALKHLPTLCRPTAMLYILLVGTRLRPGLLTGLVLMLSQPAAGWQRLRCALRGAWAGLDTYRQSRQQTP